MRAILCVLLVIGSVFFAFEFALHLFGLPILEHDAMFIPTHDRYIALYALTYAALLTGIAVNVAGTRRFFVVTMIGILLGFVNAGVIALQGGYRSVFPVAYLDGQLRTLGVGAYLWYACTWIAWWFDRTRRPPGP